MTRLKERKPRRVGLKHAAFHCVLERDRLDRTNRQLVCLHVGRELNAEVGGEVREHLRVASLVFHGPIGRLRQLGWDR